MNATTLEKRVVQDFVKANRRTPTKRELSLLIEEAKAKYPQYEILGTIAYDKQEIKHRMQSSARTENAHRRSLVDDLQKRHDSLRKLDELLEEQQRAFMSNTLRLGQELQEVEEYYNLVLLSKEIDVFTDYIEEHFTDMSLVDNETSTATVERNNVTLGYRKWDSYENIQSITAQHVSDKHVASFFATSPAKDLFFPDGRNWEYLVYTDYQKGNVSLLLTIKFDEPVDIQSVRLNCFDLSGGKETITVMYSSDNKNYAPLDWVELPLEEQTIVPIGKSNVKSLRLRLKKTQADTTNETGTQNIYVWALSQISILTSFFRNEQDSKVICGPYQFRNALDEVVPFNMVKFDLCSIEPVNTFVNAWLSRDGINYIPVSTKADSSSIVRFGDFSDLASIDIQDLSIPEGALIEIEDAIDTAYLNAFVSSVFKDSLVLSSVKLYRGVNSPWKRTSSGNYRTTLFLEEAKSFTVANQVKVNSTWKSGTFILPAGYSTIEVNEVDWEEIPSGLISEEELIKADPLYPNNLRYVFEGYNYPTAFNGDAIYLSPGVIFRERLEYLPRGVFDSIGIEDPKFERVFTTEETDDGIKFLVKINKENLDWKDTTFDFTWNTKSGTHDTLWVKLQLGSFVPNVTPVIKSFSLRAI